jgi:4-amino-4-deoxy-L-arabinose transferase-like glycosyltransferase
MIAADGERSPLSQRERLALLLIAALAAALRLLWWHLGPRVIESEGIYYARVAENLAAGRGLLGLGEHGLELLYPPLYSGLLAAGVRLGFNVVSVGRAVSLLFGASLPLLCFCYARRYLSAAAGWLAAATAALHPLLVVVSTAVLTESSYLTVMLAALYFAAEVFHLGRRRAALAAGGLLGIAYLLRPEAFVLTFALLVTLLAFHRRQLRAAAVRAGLLLAVFALFALPYIGFLWKETGQLRFEAKTAEGVLMAQSQLPMGQFRFGITDQLVETGVSNTSDLEQIRTTHVTLAGAARLMAHQALRDVPHLLHGLGDAQLGAPFLLALAALGLFAVPWDRGRAASEAPLLVATGLTLLTYLTWPFSHDRFLYPVLPALVVWGGAGLAHLRGWALGSATRSGLSLWPSRGLVALAVAVPMALTAACGALGVRWSDELSQSWNDAQLQDDAALGRWLREQGHPVRIMDTGPTVAFYAGDVLVLYPWTDADTALRYLAAKRIAFLIMRDGDRKARPYLDEWRRSPPTGRLQLRMDFAGAAGVTRVYRWRDATPPPASGAATAQ